MPANLPPQYFGAEKRLRLAGTPQEKINAIQEMIGIMPHHKGTDRLRADLRTKIARLNKEMQKKRGARIYSYSIKKEGVAQVLLLGLPNVGKSKLLSILTNASPEVAPYPFTTGSPVIGMMQFENVQIQLVDLPALTHEFTKRWMGNLIYSADLLLLVIDLNSDINPSIEKLEELRVRARKVMVVGNKLDLPDGEKNFKYLKEKLEGNSVVGVSAEEPRGLEELKNKIYSSLDIIRVYTKEPGKQPDFGEPVVLPGGSTVINAAREIHKDFAGGLNYARIWSNKFKGQRAGKEHKLEDGDVIEFHI
ncbi:50S ribosome-binding GTPase [candidate division WOR-3 bacterium]|nr:50S ribosome-binding GTPase [candidate division WOR-3 bacterium]